MTTPSDVLLASQGRRTHESEEHGRFLSAKGRSAMR